jgi:hypothetical protein
MTKKIPLQVQKIAYKIYMSVTSSSFSGFIYLRALHRIQGKKDVLALNLGPAHDNEVLVISLTPCFAIPVH